MTVPALVLSVASACLLLGLRPDDTRSGSQRPRFQDLTPKSSFSYVTDNGFRGRKYFPQPMCGGVAVLDYDSDGIVDLYFTNGAEFPELRKSDARFYHCLLRGKGDGTFEDRTAAAKLTGHDLDYSMGVAAGDYDNDGHTDLFVCNAGRNTLYRNRGDGTFEDVTQASGAGTKPQDTLSVAAAWFDYDNDGFLDLVVSNYTLWKPETDKVCKTRDGAPMYCSPTLFQSVPNRLYRNLQNGRFEDVTESAGLGKALGKGMGINIADFNGDGWLDVFIANDTEPNLLYMNGKGGKFIESAVVKGVAYNDDASPVSGMGADSKDYDGDGLPDVFYNDVMSQTWALFRNRGSPGFEYVSARTGIASLSLPYSGWSAAFVDYNNDGWKDIYSANGDVDDLHPQARQHDVMFENTGGRSFLNISEQLGQDFLRTGFQRGSAVTDFDKNGFPDLVVTSLGERPRLLQNSGVKDANWIWIELEGTRSNRDAIGAQVKLTTESGRVLHNHVTTSVGFMSSSDKRLHFGLGPERGIRSLDIVWPRGGITRMTDVPVNRHMHITEPKS